MTRARSLTLAANDGSPLGATLYLPHAGKGPGLLLWPDVADVDAGIRTTAAVLAEEGYTVMVPEWPASAKSSAQVMGWAETGLEAVAALLAGLREQAEAVGQTGMLGFGAGGLLALQAAARCWVDCAVAYCPALLTADAAEFARLRVPVLVHGTERQLAPGGPLAPLLSALGGNRSGDIQTYPDVAPDSFRRGAPGYDAASALIAHQRTVVLLHRTMGPHYDFSTLWDLHCACEFATRDVDATMATMVDHPYVNHIPTMTGGVGHDQLKRFYKYHFIPKTPADTRLIPISRTIGATSLVDELLFCFTHHIEIDWMLPGIPPTGRYVEIPLVAIVRFRGDKLYNEHIYWDQASVLVQIGRLDPKGLPVAGVETARKLVDETLPSNTLMAAWEKSEGGPP